MTPEVKRITSELELLKRLLRSDAEGYVVVVTAAVDVDRDGANIGSAARLLRLNDSDVKRVFNFLQATPGCEAAFGRRSGSTPAGIAGF